MTLNIAAEDYRVNLEIFEGPLDLLMHLIRKNDMDICDIPISFVLEEYMKYLDTLKELDIDLAGEFLLMAAELAHIKSRLLLPDESDDGEVEEEDPRSDLVRRLLEYQQFKEASESLMKRQLLDRDVFVQQSPEKVESTEEGPVEGDIYDLISAFSKILKKVPAEHFHNVAVDTISVNERIYQIISQLKKGMTKTIDDMLAGDYSRGFIVVTFLALLEMSKLRMIRVYQSSAYGPIHLQCVMEEVREEDIAKLVRLDTESNASSSESKSESGDNPSVE